MIELNPEQKKAADIKEGPLLILAGAGSGKTSTMTARIATLLKSGVSPYSILAVTFTNKAAGEMRERVEAQVGGMVPMWIMTFHAACLRILRAHADKLGYGCDFVVYDTVDIKSCLKHIMKDLDIDTKQFPISSVMAKISDCKENEMTPDEYEKIYANNYREQQIVEIYKEYEKTLRRSNAMDFDDLLLNVVRLFDEHDDVLEKYRERFRYIMVDEYQDTNHVQYKFVSALAAKHKNICVVGDDDQCIYEWRGADIRNILEFEKDFPDATVIKLEQNYRSTGNILAAAHSVIENNRSRKSKKLWTQTGDGDKVKYRRADSERDEANYIAQEISRMNAGGRSYHDFAVLYRVNAQSRVFEEALSQRDIPYRVVGSVRYYERKEIKDMLAYMRLVQNPADDISLTRIINEPKRGIGATTVGKLAALASSMDISIFLCISDKDLLGGINSKATAAIEELVTCIRRYAAEKDNLRVADIYDGLLRETGYIDALEKENTIEADARIENLMEFKTVIEDYDNGNIAVMDAMAVLDEVEGIESERNLAGFLEKITLLSDIDNHDDDAQAVTLMTLHSAKGLEFPVVFMPGMEDGLFPGWRSIDDSEKVEEERRLCYVGMTRAKEKLYLTSAAYRTMYGKGSYTRESLFMRELDPHLVDGDAVFERKSDVRFGERKSFDGYQQAPPQNPFDRLTQAKKEVKGKQSAISVVAGDKVSHAKFGSGLVLKVEGNICEVMFDTVGKKKLALDMAPLNKI